MRAEILTDPRMADRGKAMIEAMIATCPIPFTAGPTYRGDAELLVTYGMGHEVRRKWQDAHLKNGGRVIGWDLGYWNRSAPDAAMRCTIDTDHPPQWLRDDGPERWDGSGIRLKELHRADGPIVLIGQGTKSRRMLDARGDSWEDRMASDIRAALPRRTIVFRPKRIDDPRPHGMRVATTPHIEQAIAGASIVVCRYSNVAVDACIAGIPVVCFGGAASRLYGSDLCNIVNPTPAQRMAFLRSLAWWQWRPSEAAQAWEYLLSRILSG